jgi:hypothetical protein
MSQKPSWKEKLNNVSAGSKLGSEIVDNVMGSVKFW